MFITRKNYQNNIQITRIEGILEGRVAALHDLGKCEPSICKKCPPDWPKNTRKGQCTHCGKKNVRVKKNHIEGGQDCYNCAQAICFGAAIRRMN